MKSTCLLIVCSLLLSASARDAEKLPGPILNGLGNLHHPVKTISTQAQKYFDQGLTLSFAFNHKEAIRAFKSAAQLDPNCSMAWWGVAYASGPHVNKPISREEHDQAWHAVEQAQRLRDNASPAEQAYIDAIAARYQKEFREDRSALDKAYAEAMRKLVKKYPDDLDAQVLLAEAIMDTMPWDYWTKDRSPKPETEEVFKALRTAIQRNPDHPGANHLYIHAVEAGPNPEWALPSADRLLNFAPAAGHLVHMPAHIYIRVGQYNDAIMANERAVKADQSYIRQCKAQGFYPGAYYPHNIHFLWYALVFDGQSTEAIKAARKSAKYAVDNACGPSKAVEAPRFRHLPAITMARFARWDEVLALPEPAMTNDFLVDRIMWHFARGVAYSAMGKADLATAEHLELSRLAASPEASKLDAPTFPATAVFAVAKAWLAGKVAQANRRPAEALSHFEQAVSLEDEIPYMEPSFWPIPVRPTLGAAYLQVGDFAKAEQVFRDDLARLPRNGWGLYGLEQALRRQGKDHAADIIASEFKQSWKRADTQLELAWF